MATIKKRSWQTKKGISTAWEVSYYKDGTRHRKTFKRKPTLDEIAALSQTTIKNPYFKEALEDYIKACSLHCKESTIETYNNYKEVALSSLHFKKLKTLNRNEMSKFLIELKEEKAPKTFNNILMFLKGFFNYMVEIKTISENPIRKIKSLPIGTKQAKALEENVRVCFIKYSEKAPPWVHLFFMTMYYMGLRISECIALEWSDIDLKNKTMSINKQYYRYRLTSTKNYETRIIDMPDSLIELYKKQVHISPLVFNSSKTPGKHVNVNNLRETYFEKIIEAVEDELDLNLSDITPHCLRHTHATYLLSNGIPVKYVSERLGHRDTNTTLNIYNHVLPSDNKKALDLLNNLDGRKKDTKNKMMG